MSDCDDCGLDFDSVSRSEIGPRVRLAAEAISDMLLRERDQVMTRPSPDRWSGLEYAAHVRDVLLTIRDRLVIGVIEENAGFKPLYREERLALGLHAADTPDAVADEIIAAAAMFTRLFDAIDSDQLDRVVRYGHPDPQPATLLWMGRQAVHESEHHLWDISESVVGAG